MLSIAYSVLTRIIAFFSAKSNAASFRLLTGIIGGYASKALRGGGNNKKKAINRRSIVLKWC